MTVPARAFPFAATRWLRRAATSSRPSMSCARRGRPRRRRKRSEQHPKGMVSCYIHAGGKIGVLVEMNCESDFVARTEDFQRLCHDVAMHIAALDPRFLRREEVTQEILDREREIYREQAKATGKPEPVIEKIVSGKMEKFYEENCLYEQHFIKDEGVTMKELVDQAIAKVGENIAIRRFSRFKVGEMEPVSRLAGTTDCGSKPIHSRTRPAWRSRDVRRRARYTDSARRPARAGS